MDEIIKSPTGLIMLVVNLVVLAMVATLGFLMRRLVNSFDRAVERLSIRMTEFGERIAVSERDIEHLRIINQQPPLSKRRRPPAGANDDA